ncbi:hypothetical protein V8G54_024458 [Vigna mungo]|uniref:TraB domain-containing protein n=1 Tax=Vigna mungo TaxID=3915 RepID=A0AAQ3N706_VIGMU
MVLRLFSTSADQVSRVTHHVPLVLVVHSHHSRVTAPYLSSQHQILYVMFQRLIGHLVIRTRTLNQLARVTSFIHRHKSLLAAPFSCSQTLSSLQFSTDTSAFTHHPVRLPEDLSKNLIVLSCESSAEGGVCHVYLVGVSHGSKVLILVVQNQESYRRVQATVKFLKPEAVFLELCQSRASILTRKNYKTADDPHEDEFRVAYEEAIKYGGKVIFGDRPDKVFPGSEFRVAYEDATKYGGRVILGDRPVQVGLVFQFNMFKAEKIYTLLMLNYPLNNRVMFFTLMSRSSIDRIANYIKEILDSCLNLTWVCLLQQKETDDSGMNMWCPTFMEVFVHERDLYMSSTLLKVASENSSVVAVVGKGHLQGIKKHWKQPVVVKDLMTVPEPAVSAIRIVRSVVVVLAAVAIISESEITLRDDGVVIISRKK